MVIWRQIKKNLILFILSGFFLNPAWAALSLQLTHGSNSAIPLGLITFAGDRPIVPGSTMISNVINNDLTNSGQFKIVSPSLFFTNKGNLQSIDYDYWQKNHVNAVLVGEIMPIGNQIYRVHIKLYDAYQKDSDAGKSNVLLDETLTSNINGLRLLSHRISDLVYKKMTGIPGIFATKIAYITLHWINQRPIYNLMVSDEDGFKPQSLLVSQEPIMSPGWAPDGKSIAYVSFERHRAAIYLQNLMNGSRTIITEFPGVNGAPAFSPDGQKLALVLTLEGNPKIYVYQLSNRHMMQITYGYSIDTEPAWSPDSQSLIFTSDRGGTPQIYRYYFNTKQIERVTFTGNYNARAAVLPNQQGIVMMHRDQNLFGIAYQDFASGQIRGLIQSGFDESPSLAPNGQMVLYATQQHGKSVLAMVSIDGKIRLFLPAQDGDVHGPAWSPFLN